MSYSVNLHADTNLLTDGTIKSLTDNLLENNSINIDSIINQFENLASNGFNIIYSIISEAINGILNQIKLIIDNLSANDLISTVTRYLNF